MKLRLADGDDAASVAALHADSWRRHYRGSYPDHFLDGPVVDDRLAVWTERLSAGEAGIATVTIVAEVPSSAAGVAGGPALIGFAHVVLDADPRWGALVDNLHVRHDHKGGGIGTVLLARAAGEVAERRPGSGLFLWVLEDNRAAQRFYRARGAVFEGTKLTRPPGGGRELVALRCAWPDPTVLLEAGAP